MPRHQTPEDKARWAEYMRNYRAKNPKANRRSHDLPPTERQLQILRMYADPVNGGTQEKVAQALGISKSAVHNQLQRLMRRLEVHDPAQAIMKLWVNPNEPTSEAERPPRPDRGRHVHRPRPARRADDPA